ncbi:MAG: RluA family pseudouridine synthase [Oscillospiraceae bacterium]|nr:RluA family pseudouridine synthase [Oscillospiraceae bacterium]
MKEYIIGNNDAGQRLDRFTAKAVPLLPASLMQKYIRIKRIKVNGKGAKREYKLALDDVVQLYINDEFFEAPDKENAYLKITDPALEIIYEDENIILVNKPAGILCHSDGTFDYSNAGSSKRIPLVSVIQSYLHKNGEWRPREENSFTPALCNRIDRNTSGIVIAAKNAETLRIINEKLKQQEIDRYYLAVVHGKPNPPEARLEGYIFKDAVKNRVYVTKDSQPGSKSAVMEYKTLNSSGQLSLLECRLFTGRTHQIRAQLASAGYPILGDSKYGNGRLDKPYGETKQSLCSYKLVFSFNDNTGLLDYLNRQEFKLSTISFAEKYFSQNI